MIHLALIGQHLQHSFSRQYYEAVWKTEGRSDCSYRLQEMSDLHRLRQWVEDEHIRGFNVTFPFKEAVMPYLDCVDETAQKVGAVNCVTVEGERLVGHNTDAPAFGCTLQGLPVDGGGLALVLGTGGAARAVAYSLQRAGIDYRLVSRTPTRENGATGYAEARDMVASGECKLLVNATPVGTSPHVDDSPWPWPEVLGGVRVVYDLVYNPSPSLLLQQALRAGCTIKDGLEMLHIQADLSWQLYKNI